MIGLNNADSSFFSVTSPDVPAAYTVLTDDIISFSITEEVKSAIQGTIKVYDPELMYSRHLRTGLRLNVSWGYKDPDSNSRTLLALKQNKQEAIGAFARSGINAFVMSPGGSGEENGVSTYSCNFYGSEYRRGEEKKIYQSGTKWSVINEVFIRMGCSVSEINFKRGKDSVTGDRAIRQYETDFRFLQRCASEWHCIFRIGHTPAGTLYGLFIDEDKFDSSQFYKATAGVSVGNSIYVDWKWGVANVKNYTWKHHVGEGGQGDSVRMVYLNGQTTFIRYVTKGEKVIAYRFVPEKVTRELKRKASQNGISGMNDYMEWAMNVKDFSELVNKKYFVPYEESTAPQGLGYSADLDMIGNPMVTPPMMVKFGKGFPDAFSSRQTKYFIKKVEHTIDKSGYVMKVEVMDAFTMAGGSFIGGGTGREQ